MARADQAVKILPIFDLCVTIAISPPIKKNKALLNLFLKVFSLQSTRLRCYGVRFFTTYATDTLSLEPGASFRDAGVKARLTVRVPDFFIVSKNTLAV